VLLLKHDTVIDCVEFTIQVWRVITYLLELTVTVCIHAKSMKSLSELLNQGHNMKAKELPD
jgi:hypothetical protein